MLSLPTEQSCFIISHENPTLLLIGHSVIPFCLRPKAWQEVLKKSGQITGEMRRE